MPSRPISTHGQPSGLAPVDPTFISGALGVVLQVYEATLTHDMDTFEPYALRCLGRLIGFDGAVWGSGVLQGHGIQGLSITRASVVDRPATLLSEYAGLAAFDPATLRFLACPQQPIAVGVDDYGRSRSGAAVGGYLRRHRIAQLLLQGSETAARATPVRSRQWITAYRETDRRFDGQDIARLQALLPLWNQARELCLVRQLERLGRAHLTQGTAVALCDRLGLIHVAEPAFSELTQLGRGDTVLAVRARALEPGMNNTLRRGRTAWGMLSVSFPVGQLEAPPQLRRRFSPKHTVVPQEHFHSAWPPVERVVVRTRNHFV